MIAESGESVTNVTKEEPVAPVEVLHNNVRNKKLKAEEDMDRYTKAVGVVQKKLSEKKAAARAGEPVGGWQGAGGSAGVRFHTGRLGGGRVGGLIKGSGSDASIGIGGALGWGTVGGRGGRCTAIPGESVNLRKPQSH